MCLRLQGRIRIREVLLGVVIGLGVAGVLVLWTNVGVIMKRKPVVRHNNGNDFHEHAAVITRSVRKQIGKDKPGIQENEQSALHDTTTLNDGPISLGKDIHEQAAVVSRSAGIQIDKDKPSINEDEQSAIDDTTALNDDSISSDTVNSRINRYKAYGRVKTILFFIGYSRSRHTLLGSLLDAHPHMVIADETMALFKWSSKRDLWLNNSIYTYFDIMFQSAQRAVNRGRRSELFEGSVANTTSQFRYYVPNQWQGSFDKYIEVIGDKSGAYAAIAMNRGNSADGVKLLEKTAGAKVKFVHVVRNPFDNIATMVLEHRNVKARYGAHKVKVNAPEELERKTNFYFSLAKGSNKARNAFPDSFLDVPSMEIVKNPVETLRRICQFLEITCTEQYLQDCAVTVDPVPSITRHFVEWTAEQKNTVYEMMKKYPFFEGYSFDK